MSSARRLAKLARALRQHTAKEHDALAAQQRQLECEDYPQVRVWVFILKPKRSNQQRSLAKLARALRQHTAKVLDALKAP
jgi:hypothetical protein